MKSRPVLLAVALDAFSYIFYKIIQELQRCQTGVQTSHLTVMIGGDVCNLSDLGPGVSSWGGFMAEKSFGEETGRKAFLGV